MGLRSGRAGRIAAPVAALLAATVLPGAATPAARVVGGSTIRVQQAPWTVFVEQDGPGGIFLCTGSLIDASHVVTAAHCLYDESGRQARPRGLAVKAGVSNYSAPLRTDAEQNRDVRSVRVHPGFDPGATLSEDDVAVLTLTRPFRLGPAVKTLNLPTPDAPYPRSTVTVGLAGFGRDAPSVSSSGPLEWMTGTISPRGSCPSFSGGPIPGNAVLFCGSAVTSAVCSGDSGSALVSTQGHHVLLGVADAGATNCLPGTDAIFANVGAPEILRFLRGDDHPPRAPRETPETFVRVRWKGQLVVGTTVSCVANGWSSQGRISYSFVGGAVTQHGGRRTFRVPAADAYASISCEVTVTNSGGTTISDSPPTPPVLER